MVLEGSTDRLCDVVDNQRDVRPVIVQRRQSRKLLLTRSVPNFKLQCPALHVQRLRHERRANCWERVLYELTPHESQHLRRAEPVTEMQLTDEADLWVPSQARPLESEACAERAFVVYCGIWRAVPRHVMHGSSCEASIRNPAKSSPGGGRAHQRRLAHRTFTQQHNLQPHQYQPQIARVRVAMPQARNSAAN